MFISILKMSSLKKLFFSSLLDFKELTHAAG